MIVPTRFGLKYAPIPTLALEYEDDLTGVVDATSDKDSSLYVYRDENSTPSLGPSRKLHVVELPTLTRTSETQQITRQLQQDNGRFLAPGVVSGGQLKRLLDRLVQNLPEINEDEQRPPSLTVDRQNNAVQEEGSEVEESAMEDSVMEESVVEASQSEEKGPVQAKEVMPSEENPNRGSFVTHEESEDGAETDPGEQKVESNDTQEASHGNDGEEGNSPAVALPTEEESEGEAEEDAKKTKALRSESDVSDEEVQSEELEYFSEDGSDEDSF
ncbi:hypothetical protein P3T76_003045 [Phytophthora citrophthora]|uniref:Uncharacterized protein n=1 Tax=Phytophthora citrophthora TaxID=4793 RepID=A0AAD9LSZ0_9STRA|nr:hypothetical protein P3T76_003045 [Phytophthora citrophthora]